MRKIGASNVGFYWTRHWILQMAGILAWLSPIGAGAQQPNTLTNAQQVMNLGLEGSKSGNIPVALRATIIFQAINRPDWVLVQDNSGAVLITLETTPGAVVPGQILEVEGVAKAGLFAPFVAATKSRFLERGPMPEPKRGSPEQWAAGADFARYVTCQATVLDVALLKDRLILLCSEQGTRFQVWAHRRDWAAPPVDLLDARVELRGTPWTLVDYFRHPVGFNFQVTGTNDITILRAGSADIFHTASRTIDSIRTNAVDRNRRVKVIGVVTCVSPAGWLSVQDTTGGLMARLFRPLAADNNPGSQYLKRRVTPLRVGDRIELAGFAVEGRPFAPLLEDSEYKLLKHGAPLAGEPATSADLMSGKFDQQLVKLKAKVLETETHRGQKELATKVWLQSGDATFEAGLVTSTPIALGLLKNDFVEVTGVCDLQVGYPKQVRSFRLIMNQPGDLGITRAPPWWTLRWAVLLLTVAGVLFLAGLVWIRALRRQVSHRTAELSETNQRLLEQIRERRRFVSITEATSDLVAMAALDGRVMHLNKAGRKLMEIPEDLDITQLEMGQFYPEDVNQFFHQTAIPHAMKEGSWSGEVRLLTSTKREVPVSFVGLVIKSSEGVPEHLACVARDISERHRAEKELRDALAAEKELNRLKSNFVSMVSHEFRTPLGTIRSSAELLHSYHERLAPERRARLLEAISASTTEMARMMEDVLLLSRVESARYEFQPTEVNLGELCRRLADEALSASAGRCTIDVAVGVLPEHAWCDEGLLRHIFQNLLSNAIKYSPPESRIILRVIAEEQTAVFVVTDQGKGISVEDQPRLFQAFMRGSNVSEIPGTGLGLVIVKRCVELHGGTVQLESAIGEGTTVTVRLPLFMERETDTSLIRKWNPNLNSSV